jgi:hypothetical protein
MLLTSNIDRRLEKTRDFVAGFAQQKACPKMDGGRKNNVSLVACGESHRSWQDLASKRVVDLGQETKPDVDSGSINTQQGFATRVEDGGCCTPYPAL